jgi:dTDP-glucose pyrophosphorylase
MWGLIPAAGLGTRIQPLGFSKELLPLGDHTENGRSKPKAVSEYLIERMLLGGVTKICFVISPGKTDILKYYGSRIDGADVCYVVQGEPRGLCDAIFCAGPLITHDQSWIVGLPDTIWFPNDALTSLPDGPLSLLLFPVERPELFDAVLTDDHGRVGHIAVKKDNPGTHWIWGAFRLRGDVFLRLLNLWRSENSTIEYWGTLVNLYLQRGGSAIAVRGGQTYLDVGTLTGFEEAMREVSSHTAQIPQI